jgi:hypothetical protein
MDTAGRTLCEQEIVREGRRVLRQLSESGGHLMPVARGVYGLVSCALPDTIRVEAEVVKALRSRDWLNPRGTDPETFVLSDPGLFWLRREQAEHEPFAAQHQLRAERMVRGEDGVEHKVLVNEGESPLGWLRKRGGIDPVQFEAGERLRRDFTLAAMTPRMAANFDTPMVDGQRAEAEFTELVVAAKQRFSRAMQAAGPSISDLLFDVCCHLIGLEMAESTRAWPRRTAKVVLQIGLDRLAQHYGMRALAQHAALRGWRLEEA